MDKTKSNTFSIAKYIDHTLLNPIATNEAYTKLCEEAIKHEFAGVCVPPHFVKLCNRLLHETNLKLSTVIGFPFGYENTQTKVFAIQKAITDGANEIDAVMNIAALKSGEMNVLKADITHMVDACHLHGVPIKLIIETAYLNEQEITQVCEIAINAGVDCIKTSTGYAPEGANVEKVALLRSILPANIKIKASGGIKDKSFATELINSGADRIGTSSGITICT